MKERPELVSELLKVDILAMGDDCVPDPATDGSAGMDLRAALDAPVTLKPLGRCLIPTGIAVAIPPGHVGLVCPRSGLAINHGVVPLNAPGVVDADYRGVVGVVLINLGEDAFEIMPEMRIAQLVIVPFDRVKWNRVNVLPQTQRGSGGFGSSGVK